LPLPYRWQTRIDRVKDEFRGLFGGGQQQPRPRICPVCNSLVGINTSRCHECGTNLNFSLAAMSKQLGALISTDTPVTTVLLITNFIMFGITVMMVMQAGNAGGFNLLWRVGGESTFRLGESLPFIAIREWNQWWRFVTAMFLHGGLIHIGLNMMSLFQLGPIVEEIYGSARFLFIYIVTGAFGFFCSSYFLGGHVSVGASAALLGLVGVLLALTYKRGGGFALQLRRQLISSTVMLFAIGIFGGFAIDNWAHGGGLAAGLLLGRVFADRQPANNSEKQRAQLLGWAAALITLACFVFMIMHFRDPLPGAG
jgi:membrane associated rhomboid family serine protease